MWVPSTEPAHCSSGNCTETATIVHLWGKFEGSVRRNGWQVSLTITHSYVARYLLLYGILKVAKTQSVVTTCLATETGPLITVAYFSISGLSHTGT